MVAHRPHDLRSQLRRRPDRPELAHGPNWPYEIIGIAFAVVGFGFVSYGYVRHRDVEHALDRGDYTSLPGRVAIVFAGAGALLGLATIVLLVLHPG